MDKQLIIKQQGFTLIELMIALVLGLIVIAAATGIYLANYRTLATQRSGSEMQSASIFGVQPLEARLRLANLGSSITSITDSTDNTGIVLKDKNAPKVTDDNLRSKSASGPSNTNINSDQLTIQYTNATPFAMYDCEGNEVAKDAKSIERYFIRQGNSGLVLACDAGVYAGDNLTNFGDNGAELISGVDQFRIMLGVQELAQEDNNDAGIKKGDATTRFYNINEYKNLALKKDKNGIELAKPSIVSIRIGVIARGTTPITTSAGLSSFTLFGGSETLKSDVPTNVVRNTFETTTLLRNARVENFEATVPTIQ